MPLSRKRKPKLKKNRDDKQREHTEQVAHELYQNRLLLKRSGDAQSDWKTAEKIVSCPFKTTLFASNRPLIKLEKTIWQPILDWADNQALLRLLGVVSNIGLIIAVGMYIGSEKQRRDTEVLTAWQTLTNAHGQPGNGGRIHALEFLNASPRNQAYDYPGANWRRRSICLWICAWQSESLSGISLSAGPIETPLLINNDELPDDRHGGWEKRTYLSGIQLPVADLKNANLEGANLTLSNLESTDFRFSNLKDANLGAANLKGANLGATILERANLSDANLEDANLGAARLKNAALWRANLAGARLWNADLTGTSLWFANLEGISWWDATLTDASLWKANFSNADRLTQEQLTQAKLCWTRLPPDISLDPNRDCEEIGIDPETGEPAQQDS